MLTQINNRHHSKLPRVGEIGYLISGTNRFGETNYFRGERQTYQVYAYPLNDNVAPYSYGIHTAFFKNLKTGNIVRLSGFYFNEQY